MRLTNPIPVFRETKHLGSAPSVAAHQLCGCNHFVQFYERDESLVEAVTDFFAPALLGEDSVVLIATEAHRRAIEELLLTRNVDLEHLTDEGRYVSLNAAETLEAFMIDDAPDADLFRQSVGSLVQRALKNGRHLRGFGEMVALLWADGNGKAAIELEELWNDLGRAYPFSLFCAYPMAQFQGDEHREVFAEICRTHTHVIPAESYTSADGDLDRLRQITLLQQKAASLEGEITDRKHAQQALAENEGRLSLAVDLGDLGIWEVNTATGEFTCCERCRTHLRVTDADLSGPNDLFKHLGDEDRSVLNRHLAAGGEFALEAAVCPPNGGTSWVAIQGRRAAHGSSRLIGVTKDLTASRENAAALEKAVLEKTAELQTSLEALDAFAHSVAHDLRAPLRSMRCFAEIVLGESGTVLSTEHRDHLEKIIRSGDRMDSLIQDILTFSRISRADVSQEPVNLDHILRGVIECSPHLHPPRASVRIEGALPVVLGNAAALTQCFANLLCNAVKFVPRGRTPKVKVWSDRVGSRVRIYIRDNGIGMSAEERKKIFGIFQRIDSRYEGTGVGLSIVQKAATRMGGGVGCDSQPDKGSTFWIDLKAAS